RRDDLRLVTGEYEPDPAGSELRRALGVPLGHEGVVAPEAVLDEVGDLTGRRAATARFHGVPEERVVPDLGGVVEYATGGGFDDRFEGLVRLGLTVEGRLELGHVALVVLPVVEFEGLGADRGGEGGLFVG